MSRRDDTQRSFRDDHEVQRMLQGIVDRTGVAIFPGWGMDPNDRQGNGQYSVLAPPGLDTVPDAVLMQVRAVRAKRQNATVAHWARVDRWREEA